jgi:hypothetical protein
VDVDSFLLVGRGLRGALAVPGLPRSSVGPFALEPLFWRTTAGYWQNPSREIEESRQDDESGPFPS